MHRFYHEIRFGKFSNDSTEKTPSYHSNIWQFPDLYALAQIKSMPQINTKNCLHFISMERMQPNTFCIYKLVDAAFVAKLSTQRTSIQFIDFVH